MGLSELGEGKISCGDFKQILNGKVYSIFNYDTIGGLIDMEQDRLNGPTIISMLISLIVIVCKYIAIFIISKIEYVAIGIIIYFLVLIFLKVWKWLFNGQDGIIGGFACAVADIHFDFKVPTISVSRWSIGGESIVDFYPFRKIIKPITDLIGCPAGADELFEDKYGSCEARFAGQAAECSKTFATDFTLYYEKSDGTPDRNSLCDNIGHCKNAPEHYIIKDSISFPLIGWPMVGLKGIGFGSAPFKYLTCCASGQNHISDCGINSPYYKKAQHAALASSSIPPGFDDNLLNNVDSNASGTPFKDLDMYTITENNFNTFKLYNTDEKNCSSSGLFAGFEDSITDFIAGIRIIIWILIVALIFVQINIFVKRIYYGYLLCSTYDNNNETNFNKALLGIMGKKTNKTDDKLEHLIDKGKGKISVEKFEEEFPICGHLLYCLDESMRADCNSDNLHLHLHHKGNMVSTINKSNETFNRGKHSAGKHCFDSEHSIVKQFKKSSTGPQGPHGPHGAPGAPSTLLGGDIPPEAFLIIIFSFISGSIMIIINYMKKK